MKSLTIDNNDMQYKTMIGAGGIGSGKFFLLEGNHTLGREESRSGHYLPTRDYCKLHIISHYVKALMGSDFTVTPIGKIGRDQIGQELVKEMEEIGLNLNYLKHSEDSPTLFSFCFAYPDGTGGNMTTNDSACAQTESKDIQEAEREFISYKGNGIALAVPEVSLEARKALLELATENGFFRVASFTSEEILKVVESNLLKRVDLLAINLDEAAAAVGMSVQADTGIEIVHAVIELLGTINANLWISITNGKDGSWAWNGESLTHAPIYSVDVKSTAGAGDAHVSGLIAGLTAGLNLKEAQQLGALVSAHAVNSPHTINKETNRESLLELIIDSENMIYEKNLKLLKG